MTVAKITSVIINKIEQGNYSERDIDEFIEVYASTITDEEKWEIKTNIMDFIQVPAK